MEYTITYICGRDLKYKAFVTAAENREDAIHNLWESYPDGDFDHQIISITIIG